MLLHCTLFGSWDGNKISLIWLIWHLWSSASFLLLLCLPFRWVFLLAPVFLSSTALYGSLFNIRRLTAETKVSRDRVFELQSADDAALSAHSATTIRDSPASLPLSVSGQFCSISSACLAVKRRWRHLAAATVAAAAAAVAVTFSSGTLDDTEKLMHPQSLHCTCTLLNSFLWTQLNNERNNYTRSIYILH